MSDEGVREAPAMRQSQPATPAAPARTPSNGPRSARRGRKKRHGDAVPAEDAKQPNLGALNRHLSMIMQQLTAAHQTIGRVVAERDALRQQIADFTGVPIEEIPLPKVDAVAEAPPPKTP